MAERKRVAVVRETRRERLDLHDLPQNFSRRGRLWSIHCSPGAGRHRARKSHPLWWRILIPCGKAFASVNSGSTLSAICNVPR